MRGATPAENIKYWLFKDKTPFTKFVAAIFVLTGFVALFSIGSLLTAILRFDTLSALKMPWTFFTYPLLGNWRDILGTVFGVYWLWWAGGSLERSWGSRTFAAFFFITSALTALGLFAASVITQRAVGIEGLWVSLAAITVAFGMLNPEQTILFMLIIPIKMKYLAIISAAGILVRYIGISPLHGFLALAGCAAAYWYVRYGFQYSVSRGPDLGKVIHIHPSYARKRGINPFQWLKERKEQKRLKDLFKNSGLDD